MRTLFIITCLANIAFAFGSLPWMPEKVATSMPCPRDQNGFASPIALSCAMSGAVVFMGLALIGMTYRSVPNTLSKYPHFPNSDYWLNEENRPKTIRRLRSCYYLIGIWVMLCLLSSQWDEFRANQMVSPEFENSGMTIFCVYAFFVPLGIYPLWIMLSFRLPKGKGKGKE